MARPYRLIVTEAAGFGAPYMRERLLSTFASEARARAAQQRLKRSRPDLLTSVVDRPARADVAASFDA